MCLKYILFITVVLKYAESFGPSYRSSWVEDGKPILRMPSDEGQTLTLEQKGSLMNIVKEADSLIKKYGLTGALPHIEELFKGNEKSIKVLKIQEAPWMSRLREDIEKLIEKHGLFGAMPHLHELIKADPEASKYISQYKGIQRQEQPEWLEELRESGEYFVKKYGLLGALPYLQQLIKGNKEAMQYLLKYYNDRNGLRSWFFTTVPPVTEEPQWARNLKDFLKSVEGKYDQATLEKWLRPLTRVIEHRNKVKINGINKDEAGNIIISFQQLRMGRRKRVYKRQSEDENDKK